MKKLIEDTLGITPTEEQLNIVDYFNTGNSIVIKAGAGASKTTTLKMCRMSNPKGEALFLTYNKALSDETKIAFDNPIYGKINVKTFHGMVFGHYAFKYKDNFFKKGHNSFKKASIPFLAERYKTSYKIVSHMNQTLESYYNTDDILLSNKHISSRLVKRYLVLKAKYEALDDNIELERIRKDFEKTKKIVLELSKRYLKESLDFNNFAIPICHSGYLKKFQLDKEQISSRVGQVFVDEAQDLNAVQIDILKNQCTDKQFVVVGDEYQCIYMWRGASNNINFIENSEQFYLTNSFRIKASTAGIANSILDRAYPTRDFFIKGLSNSTADKRETKIFRKNKTVMTTAIKYVKNKTTFHINDPSNKITTAYQNMVNFVKTGKKCGNIFYESVDELKEAIKNEIEFDYLITQPYLLIEQIGINEVINIIEYVRQNNHKKEGICLTTAHGCKGLEWDKVYISCDFLREDKKTNCFLFSQEAEEVNLMYVAVTRAKNELIFDPEYSLAIEDIKDSIVLKNKTNSSKIVNDIIDI